MHPHAVLSNGVDVFVVNFEVENGFRAGAGEFGEKAESRKRRADGGLDCCSPLPLSIPQPAAVRIVHGRIAYREAYASRSPKAGGTTRRNFPPSFVSFGPHRNTDRKENGVRRMNSERPLTRTAFSATGQIAELVRPVSSHHLTKTHYSQADQLHVRATAENS